jgi:hypothetical protein
MSAQVAEQILAALERRHPPAAFVTEVTATLRPAPPPGEVEDALRALGEKGRVLTASHEAPDIHLEGIDLRVVAALPRSDEPAALAAAETYWNTWLRVFLSTHRCQ